MSFRVLLPFLLLATAPSLAADLLVPEDFSSVQEAVDAAKDGDVILIAAGVWTGTGDSVLNTLGKSITVRGSTDEAKTILDAEGLRRGIVCRSNETGDTVLEHLTVINGAGQWEDFNFNDSVDLLELVGGGLFISGASPTVRECVFTASVADVGAGAWLFWSESRFESCRFESNESLLGAGMNLDLFARPQLVGCTFQSNTASDGGGLYADFASEADVTECRFLTNSASSHGGGLRSNYADIMLRDSTMASNFAGYRGGGMANNFGTVSIEDCILFGNSAFVSGGGWYTTSLTAEAVRSVCNGNWAPRGGGLHLLGDFQTGDSASFDGVLITFNQADYGGGLAISGAMDVTVDHTVIGENISQLSGSAIENDSATLTIGSTTICGNSPSDIDAIEGAWNDVGGNEFAETCVVPTLLGVCCFEDGCELTVEESCNGDVWLPVGADCLDCRTTSCAGDIDFSGGVDVADLLALIASWGPCEACPADFDASGSVDVTDLLTLIAAWGPC